MTQFSFSFVNGEKRHTTISKSILFVFLYIKAKHSLKSFLDDDEEGEEGEEGEEKMPSCGDYIMHFLTLPWKLLFALIPPTGEYLIFLGWGNGELLSSHHQLSSSSGCSMSPSPPWRPTASSTPDSKWRRNTLTLHIPSNKKIFIAVSLGFRTLCCDKTQRGSNKTKQKKRKQFLQHLACIGAFII